jgi:hypothetical protein
VNYLEILDQSMGRKMYTCSENPREKTVSHVGDKEFISTSCSSTICVRQCLMRGADWGQARTNPSLGLRMVFWTGRISSDCNANPIKALVKQDYSCEEDFGRERRILETSGA